MAGRVELQRIDESGWRIGFANLLRRENMEWWRWRSLLTQALIWLAIINGLVAVILWAVPQANMDAEGLSISTPADAVPEALEVFFAIAGMATAVGIIIVMQSTIMDERQSGTLAWILSKPVSRTAVIVSKLVANAAGALVVMVIVQGAAAYLQFMLAGGSVDPLAFAGGLAILGLHLLFYLTLTLMLSVVMNNRGGVIGLSLGLVFGYQFILGILPALARFTHWGLVVPVSPEIPGLAAIVARGDAPSTVMPIVFTALWCVLFTAVAIYRFQREEF